MCATRVGTECEGRFARLAVWLAGGSRAAGRARAAAFAGGNSMVRCACALGLWLASGLAWGNPDDFGASLAKGIALLREGQYYLARDSLEAARKLAGGPAQEARARGWLGLVHYRMHHREQAETLLRETLASEGTEARDRGRWTAVLADLQAERGDAEQARRGYSEALALAAGDLALAAGIRLGQATLLPGDQRLAALQDVAGSLAGIEPPEERARFLANLGSQATGLGAGGEPLAYQSFEQAARTGGASPRVKAESLGGLAGLYQNRNRPEESLRLNAEAIRNAEAAEARDLLADLEWRSGRLQRALHRPAEALASYRRAIDHIEAIRPDIPIEYHDGRSSFRETLEPLYLEYADLLLEQANPAANAEDAGRMLRQARGAVEFIKQTELEDVLGGRCAVQGAKKAQLETLDPKTAVLYPIIFPDRLELLVSSGDELQRFTAPVSAALVQQTAQEFARALRDKTTDVLDHSRQLYRWLIAPAEPWLRQHRTDTLVIVPDGVLRLIPLAALHDGEHYLVERYAVATSPGLSLFEASPLRSGGYSALLAGVSEPGPVVDNLPRSFFQAMLAAGGKKDDALDAVDDGEFERLRSNPDFRRSLEQKLVLPGVGREIESLGQKIDGKVMLNEGFTVANFKREVTDHPYSIVHIASHGVFGSTAETSFVMAYDGVIDIDQLERLFKTEKLKNNPIELLILSACQTAKGDDRSPLGLSGVALRSNVRSALGSLWPVSDEAASRLMEAFYTALRQPGASKVQALRQAQQVLLGEPRFGHPFYWSPFILVGNWL
jgi:CHAT domain-containing protein